MAPQCFIYNMIDIRKWLLKNTIFIEQNWNTEWVFTVNAGRFFHIYLLFSTSKEEVFISFNVRVKKHDSCMKVE